MTIDELECKACGCKGIHACLGKQVPMTKVGQAIYVNGIRDFVERQMRRLENVPVITVSNTGDTK